MKSIAIAALIGAASAETNFIDFVTNMAIQEREAAKVQAAQPQFAFQELLTQMAIDEIVKYKEMEPMVEEEVEMVEEQDFSPLEILTQIALEETEDSWTDMIRTWRREESFHQPIEEFFTDMALTGRKLEAEKEDAIDVFTAMSLERRTKEAKEQDMTEAFTAMALAGRKKEAKAPKFLDFMHGLAMSQLEQPSFAESMHDMVREERKHQAVMSMQMENEQMSFLSKGLPHAMAMAALRDYEASKNQPKEVTFLNDMMHPEHAFEPMPYTAFKAVTKYYSN